MGAASPHLCASSPQVLVFPHNCLQSLVLQYQWQIVAASNSPHSQLKDPCWFTGLASHQTLAVLIRTLSRCQICPESQSTCLNAMPSSLGLRLETHLMNMQVRMRCCPAPGTPRGLAATQTSKAATATTACGMMAATPAATLCPSRPAARPTPPADQTSPVGPQCAPRN